MRVLEVHDQGLVGSLFTASDGRPCPGVLVLGGSEGGAPNDLAGLLAAEGFTCLALGYFAVPGRPRRLVEIPATIPIEQTRAPILLLSGDKDRVWPASPMAEALNARLAQLGQGDQVVHLRYPNAGHGLTPWLPTIGKRLTPWLYDFGGDRRDHRAAVRDAWGNVVAFLRQKLT